jgi:hypothetical protein
MNIYDFTCDFVKVNFNEYKCSVCNITIAYNGIDKPIMICPYKINLNKPEDYGMKVSSTIPEDKKVEELPTQPPSLIQKVFNFTKAATNHVVAGSPKCTDEQIHKRYSICNSCEFFKNNTCTKCGCSLLRERVYMNKLAWADQACPVGKWGPINEKN